MSPLTNTTFTRELPSRPCLPTTFHGPNRSCRSGIDASVEAPRRIALAASSFPTLSSCCFARPHPSEQLPRMCTSGTFRIDCDRLGLVFFSVLTRPRRVEHGGPPVVVRSQETLLRSLCATRSSPSTSGSDDSRFATRPRPSFRAETHESPCCLFIGGLRDGPLGRGTAVGSGIQGPAPARGCRRPPEPRLPCRRGAR